MAKKERTIRVFIASPGDLAVERRAFKDVIDELNGDFATGARSAFVGPTDVSPPQPKPASVTEIPNIPDRMSFIAILP